MWRWSGVIIPQLLIDLVIALLFVRAIASKLYESGGPML
jgi:hypothetical protein